MSTTQIHPGANGSPNPKPPGTAGFTNGSGSSIGATASKSDVAGTARPPGATSQTALPSKPAGDVGDTRSFEFGYSVGRIQGELQYQRRQLADIQSRLKQLERNDDDELDDDDESDDDPAQRVHTMSELEGHTKPPTREKNIGASEKKKAPTWLDTLF
ncbi:MAG TPA: hypothetical protein VGI19_11065 [Candidatus Cybelea sp.]|jgi:hypothetical protein